MAWHDMWPKQRANVTKKRMTAAEKELRARVRKNKTAAAVKESNARVSAERAQRAKQRKANAELTKQNHAEDVAKARRNK